MLDTSKGTSAILVKWNTVFTGDDIFSPLTLEKVDDSD